LSAVEEIRTKLETRLREVEAEIESLQDALTALDEQAAAEEQRGAPTTARRGRRSASTRGGRARDAHAEPSPELERLLAETGGMSAVELARQTGTDYGAVLARIRELEHAGRRRT